LYAFAQLQLGHAWLPLEIWPKSGIV
jgi:hypothetical protein